MLETCVQCTAVVAKPADIWLKGDGSETSWPSFFPMKLAIDILEMFTARQKTACVVPLCIVSGAPPAEADVYNLGALEEAWKQVHFCDSGASPCVHNLIVNDKLDKALAATKRYVDAGHLIADRGASAVVAELGCIAWKFPHSSVLIIG